MVTTDGTIGELKRSDYIEAEARVINELKGLGKPFIVILNSKNPSSNECLNIAKEIKENYDVPVMPLSVLDMREADIYEVLKTALYEYPVLDIEFSIPEWVSILDNKNEIKKHYLELIRNSTLEIRKLKDVDNLIAYFENSKYINKAYISKLDSGTGTVMVNLDSSDELYNDTLKEFIGSEVTTKASMLKVFATYKDNKEELDGIKCALKQARSTGYGIVYPSLKDMKLDTPEVIKQGSRYGVKLRAVASSLHLIRVDVASTFEPIIGSELQSKELINYIMKDYETDPQSIWKSEIFGRSLDTIVQEGIQAKLSIMPENTRYKLSQTVTKIVNKGANNLIAIVI